MTRLSEPTMELVADELTPFEGNRRWLLRSPAPGWFWPIVGQSTWCPPRATIGSLDVLGRRYALITPARFAGSAHNFLVGDKLASSLAPRAVGYRDPIVMIDSNPAAGLAGIPDAAGASHSAASTIPVAAATGRVFRAPTSGRFYGRPAPDKPPFVAAGAELAHGTTICLLEVMKTFHRVTYGGADLPETARVVRVLVAEGADVNAGEPLLALA